MQAARGVGRHRPGRRQLARELADAPGREQAGDEGEHHGERQRAAGERDARRDRRGNRGARRHVSDALEQDFAQANSVAPEASVSHCHSWDPESFALIMSSSAAARQMPGVGQANDCLTVARDSARIADAVCQPARRCLPEVRDRPTRSMARCSRTRRAADRGRHRRDLAGAEAILLAGSFRRLTDA